MAGLPPGWEWDYDGARWFYRYKPTGHVQYHFPKAGDEFPDFVDISAPAPALAPEERRESQQQVRRHASVNGGGGAASDYRQTTGSSSGRRDGSGGNNGLGAQMSATARPVSSVWDGDGYDGSAVFQPESFMYLGPGTYTDVSPLMEEEEEAAKRTVVGNIQQVVTEETKSVSPVASGHNTPMVGKSSVATSVAEQRGIVMSEPVMSQPVMSEPVMSAPAIQSESMIMTETFITSKPATIGTAPVATTSTAPTYPSTIQGAAPAVPVIDFGYEMYELPVETSGPLYAYDPVGVVAEMPTEYTAAARVETHPEPIEMADTSILAPIHTAMPEGIAELPERSSPMERRVPEVETLSQQQKQQQQVEEPKRESQYQENQRQKHQQQVNQQISQQPEPQWQQQGNDTKKQEIESQRQEARPEEPKRQEPLQQEYPQQRRYSLPQGYVPPQVQPQRTNSMRSGPQEVNPQFKITRKPTNGGKPSPKPAAESTTPSAGGTSTGGYQAYTPGKTVPDGNYASRRIDAEVARSRRISVHQEASLMMNASDTSKFNEFNPNLVPAALSPPQAPPSRSPERPSEPSEPRRDSAPGPLSTPTKRPEEAESSSRRRSQDLSHVPSVLVPARNGPRRHSVQSQLRESSPRKNQSVGQGQDKLQSQASTGAGVFKYPSVLRPARGRALSQSAQGTPENRSREASTSSVAKSSASGVSPSRKEPSPAPPKDIYPPLSTAPPPIQRPLSTAPAPYPTDNDPIIDFQNISPHRQSTSGPGSRSSYVSPPGRPASAMSVLGHGQYGVPGQTQSGGMAKMPAEPSYPAPSANFGPPVNSAQQTSQPPARPHSVVGFPSYQNAGPANLPYPSGPPMAPLQGQSRRSTITSGDVSPLRSRSESQSSVYTVQTPSPMETSRRGSSSLSITQTINGSGYTPSPPSSGMREGNTPSSTASQGISPATPPFQLSGHGRTGQRTPSNLSGQADETSYFPPQDTTPQRDSNNNFDRAKDTSKRHSMPAQELASLMQQAPQGIESFGMAGQPPNGPQRSKSLRQSATSGTMTDTSGSERGASQHTALQGQQFAQGRSSPAPPGHLLTRIEEHEEPEASFRPPPGRAGRMSVSSNMQLPSQQIPPKMQSGPSELCGNAIPSQLQGRAPQSNPVPQPLRQSVQERPTPQHYPMQGQNQPPNSIPAQGQTPQHGQPGPFGNMKPQGKIVPDPIGMRLPQQSTISRPSSIPPQGSYNSQGFAPPGQFEQRQHAQISQAQTMSSRPMSVPPQASQVADAPESNTSGMGWTSWFKSSKPSVQSQPAPASQPNAAPAGLMSRPSLEDQSGMGQNRQSGQRQYPQQPHNPQPQQSQWPGQSQQPVNNTTQSGYQTAPKSQPTATSPPQGVVQPNLPAPSSSNFEHPNNLPQTQRQEPPIQAQQPHLTAHQSLPSQSRTFQPTVPQDKIQPPNHTVPESINNKPSTFATLLPQRQIQLSDEPRQAPKPSGNQKLMPAPLFSSSSSVSPSQQVEENVAKPPVKEDKWAKPAAADYSGGDWGDDFED